MDRFADRCTDALRIVYASTLESLADADQESAHAFALREVMRYLAVLFAVEQIAPDCPSAASIREAAQLVREASEGAASTAAFASATCAARESTGIGIFSPTDHLDLPHSAMAGLAASILHPRDDSTIDSMFFQSMPLWWLGCVYQAMLALRPGKSPGELAVDQGRRKSGGVFFTPPCLVDYIARSVLTPLADSTIARLESPGAESLLEIKVLDPAMGGGDFLTRSVEVLQESAPQGLRARIAANCVYGIDIDPLAVDIARFCVWAASGFADGISDSLNAHLICGNALMGPIPSPSPNSRILSSSKGPTPTFDAVIGNPPYVASKNGLEPGRSVRGQSDSYLLFLSAAIERGLVREGGALAMVLPDPMLARENAAAIRCKLMSDWTVVSLLHIFGAFPGTEVANIVPIFRNAPPVDDTFPTARIECASDRSAFILSLSKDTLSLSEGALRPVEIVEKLSHPVRRKTILAQRRCEFLYLLEGGSFTEIVRRIHGPDLALSVYQPPFAPLRDLNIGAIYRGEEVGKAAISGGALRQAQDEVVEAQDEVGQARDEAQAQDAGLPILLGGQSIAPYGIFWEGCRIALSRVRKDLERYRRTKILIQKSSAHVIAGLDQVRGKHTGYVFPQSVYAVELRPDGIDPLYLLCILNSQVINEYVRRTVTAYKMVQPQLELEDIRALPIRRIQFTTPHGRRRTEAARGIRLFTDECLRSAENMHFPELTNFATRCLTGNPEESDVVHDMLVNLGRLAVDLTRKNRKLPSADVTHRLECVRAAIEALVWGLYSSEPAQLSLAI